MKRALPLMFIVTAWVGHMKPVLSPVLLSAAWVGHMKRALSLILIVIACVAGFLSIRGEMPFMPVFGTSMEPELHAGNLILIEEVLPSDVEVGDVIVFEIPQLVRESYNYPPVIAHRVTEIFVRDYGTVFRTKGDNTGGDPFTVRPQDLIGKVSQQIPYLGFPLLFFQSQQGLIFIIVALALLSIYLYIDELTQGKRKIQENIFAPVVRESRRNSRVMTQTMQVTEKRMERTEEALAKFASAIELYAQHLQSHTGAIQGLSEASQELKKGAAEQNKVLAHMFKSMEQAEPGKKEVVTEKEEIIAEKEEVKPEAEIQFPPGCAMSRRHLTE